MYRSELCNVILQKTMKTKHDQSKEHKYCSNLILTRYVMKDVEVPKFRDEFDPYFIEHAKKFNFFTVRTILRHYDDEYNINHEINVSNYVTFGIRSKNFSMLFRQPASDLLHTVISIRYSHKCSPKIFSEIEIVSISHPKDILINII